MIRPNSVNVFCLGVLPELLDEIAFSICIWYSPAPTQREIVAMMRLGIIVILAGTLFMAGAFVSQSVVAQDFPYSVPQAPEFDNRGNHVEPSPTEAPEAGYRQRSRQYPQENEDELRYGEVRSYAPQDAPPAPSRKRARRVQGYVPPSSGPPAMASNPPPPPPPQMQERPDCSPYPMMIARARSEPDMQAIARQYLTCLLKSGWTMDRARQQVINTIESTYRLAR
jgi:hypothetical protein